MKLSNIYDDLWMHFSGCFHYKNTRHHAERYTRALLASLEGKNGWQIAEYLGDRSPHAVQNFLGRAAWDAEKVRDVLMQYAKKHLLSDGEGGVLIGRGIHKKQDALRPLDDDLE